MLDALEVVVPRPAVGYHVVSQESVRQQHLDLLVMARGVSLRVGRVGVLVGAAPLVSGGREFVRRQRTRTRGERAREDDALFAVPRLVRLQNLGVRADVLRRELRGLVGLGVEPAEGLQVFQVVVLRERGGKVHLRVVAPLRRHDDAPNLLDLGVIGRRHAVHVPGDLRPEVRYGDELLQDVLGQDVRVPSLLDVVRVDVDVVHAQVKVGRADGPHAPVRLAAEGGLLVRRRRGDDELVAVHVGRLGRHRGERRAVGALLFNLRNLLPLQRRRGDLGAEDDVPDLRLREGGDVHVILLRVIPEDEVLEGDLDLDPLLVAEIRPDVVRLGYNRPVGFQKHLSLVVVDVERPEDENEPGEGGVRADGLEPVVVDVEQDHLRLRRLEDQISKLFNLHARLERHLKFGTLDDNVGEVQQVNLERIQHALAGDDDLLGLLLDGQRTHQRGNLLCRLPLGELPEALLPGPHARVDNLQEELAGARVEDEDGAVDGLGRQVTLERLVDRHAVHVGIVDEPDGLVAEQLAVVLRVEVRLRGLRGVQLQTLTNALAEDVERGIRLHDLGHRLLDQGLAPGEPVTVRRV